jgi:hypothetical protein
MLRMHPTTMLEKLVLSVFVVFPNDFKRTTMLMITESVWCRCRAGVVSMSPERNKRRGEERGKRVLASISGDIPPFMRGTLEKTGQAAPHGQTGGIIRPGSTVVICSPAAKGCCWHALCIVVACLTGPILLRAEVQ